MILKHYDLSENNVDEINKYVEDGKHVFILVYMEGCGPCNATRPEWAKIKDNLKYSDNDNIVVADVDNRLSSALKHIGNIDGYPTIKYITNHGKIIEPYENSSIVKKDRSAQSFAEWIESKMHNSSKSSNKSSSRPIHLTKMSSPYDVIKRLESLSHTKKHHKKHHKKYHNKQNGGNWSIKYKRSINCKKPKGFSQKQYCKRQKRHGKYMTRRVRR
jgi:hypothetical protein